VVRVKEASSSQRLACRVSPSEPRSDDKARIVSVSDKSCLAHFAACSEGIYVLSLVHESQTTTKAIMMHAGLRLDRWLVCTVSRPAPAQPPPSFLCNRASLRPVSCMFATDASLIWTFPTALIVRAICASQFLEDDGDASPPLGAGFRRVVSLTGSADPNPAAVCAWTRRATAHDAAARAPGGIADGRRPAAARASAAADRFEGRYNAMIERELELVLELAALAEAPLPLWDNTQGCGQ
jgi:hypothetical protein